MDSFSSHMKQLKSSTTVRKVWRYQRCNQKPYFEGQTI